MAYILKFTNQFHSIYYKLIQNHIVLQIEQFVNTISLLIYIKIWHIHILNTNNGFHYKSTENN